MTWSSSQALSEKSLSGAMPAQAGWYAWYVVAVLSSGYFVSLLDRFLMAVAMVPLKSALLLTDTQLGLLHGLGFVILYSIATPFMGYWADVANRRNLIALGIVVWTAATVACGLASSFHALFAARVFVGIGEAALVPAGMSLIMAYFVKEQVGRATGIFLMGGNLGAVAALVGGGLLLAYFTATGGLQLPTLHLVPWQALFVVGALPGLLVIALMFTVREPVRPARAHSSSPNVRALWEEVRPNAKAYAAHIGASTCALIVSNALAAWSTSIFVRSHGLTVAKAALIAGTFGACCGVLGQVAGGVGLDWLRKRGVAAAPLHILAVCLLSSIPTMALFTLSDGLELSVVGYTLVYLLTQAAPISAYAGIQMIASDTHRGAITGAFLTIVTLGSFGIGPAFIGIVSDHLSDGAQALAHAMFVSSVFFAILGAALALLARGAFARAAR